VWTLDRFFELTRRPLQGISELTEMVIGNVRIHRAWVPSPKWIPLSAVLGAASGATAIAFYGAVNLFTRGLLGTVGRYHVATIAASFGGFHAASGFARPWMIPLLAAVGALVSAILVFRVAPETEGHGTDVAIRAINTEPSKVRFRTVPVKMVASAITIGSGGSGGSEGPTTQMAAASASLIARTLKLDYDEARTAVTAGLAAGVGAIFRAPLGGAMLGVELLFRKDRDFAMLAPSLIASYIAYTEFGAVYGYGPMFGRVPGVTVTAPAQLLIFPLLGLLCGGLARLYTVMFYGIGRIFAGWHTWRPLRPCIAGLATGALGLLVPGVLGTGYGTIQDVLSGQRVLHISILMLLAMPLAKILGTSLSIGSGGSAGVFGPCMVVGAIAGAALWRLALAGGAHAFAPSSPALTAAVGMAACLGAAARSPLAITLIAAQTCASWWVLPGAVLAVPVAVVLMGSDSLYRAQPRDMPELAAHRAELLKHSGRSQARRPQPGGDRPTAHRRGINNQLYTGEGKILMSRYEWDQNNSAIEKLKDAVEPARQKVISHPLYGQLKTKEAVVTFMEHHAFAVWDFMSLLKSLQRNLTCVQVPWVPTGPVVSRRLINDITLVEESDELGGSFISHFELYLDGMRQAGADTKRIDAFIDLLRAGEPVLPSLHSAGAPGPSAEFVATTWEFLSGAQVHCQAAAFAFGREDLIPDMFYQVASLNGENGDLSTFVDYLSRHIQVDSEEHTPMAMQMLVDLCGDDDAKWAQCEKTINIAFAARLKLWDGILGKIVEG
jgi:H+/Cl- antiporter ClcA